MRARNSWPYMHTTEWDFNRRFARVCKWLGIAAVLFVAAVAVSACAPINAGACPPLKKYTPEQQERLYTELEALPGDAITIDVIADYMLLRDQVRACQ